MTTEQVDSPVLLSSLLHMDLLPDWLGMYHQQTSQNTSFRVTLENSAHGRCLKSFQAIDSRRLPCFIQVSVLKKIKD